ncbi:recombinase family protein, partial [Tateyamaria pelophila]|uniref:recombinase family protein n=1 Tax=Tateyamaria pelophila TaxID=328415 RepID=UPI001CBBF59C
MSWPDNDREKETARTAAQYVRMSTKHQRSSTENQANAIQRYADERGYLRHRRDDAGYCNLTSGNLVGDCAESPCRGVPRQR